jgi:hypothetical protein
MQRLLKGVCRPMRTVLVTGAAAAAVFAGTQVFSVAGSPAGPGVAAASIQEQFFGYAEPPGSAELAKRLAINDALSQAQAVGDTACRTLFATGGWDPVLGTYVGEAEISCLADTT